MEGPEAARRKAQAAGQPRGKKKVSSGNLPDETGDTRDVVGAAVAMGERLEALEGPEAARRKAHGQTAPGKRKNAGGNLPPATRAKTRDVVGAGLDGGKPEVDHRDQEVAP